MIRNRLAIAMCFVLGSACSLSDFVSGNQLPPDVSDPNVIKTRSGAISVYYSAVARLAYAVGNRGSPLESKVASYISIVGMMTDELVEYTGIAPVPFPATRTAAVDSRSLSVNDFSPDGRTRNGDARETYRVLHDVRVRTREGIGALRTYARDTPPALVGHLYAIEGLAEVLLAELYCSGIPLTTLDFEAGFTLTRGFSSEEVYRHALQLADSAILLSGDSVRIERFARIVRARALIALGEYASAKQTITSVPTDYRYALSYSTIESNVFKTGVPGPFVPAWNMSVGDREGENGFPYVSGGDPRTGTIDISGVRFPQKYAVTGVTPIVLSSGVEARLIEAEAELHANNPTGWLAVLNALRTSGQFTVGSGAGTSDTVWAPGTGASLFANQTPAFPGLRPLEDPGSDTARVSMLFAERAAWLFLTGHRQGDLRRLVRQYDRPENTVYPSGLWGALRATSYGTNTSLPVPVEEQDNNPLYHGCISEND